MRKREKYGEEEREIRHGRERNTARKREKYREEERGMVCTTTYIACSANKKSPVTNPLDSLHISESLLIHLSRFTDVA